MQVIEFTNPVTAMRGNLSGKQRLIYPNADNKAWYSPANIRNYARNYKGRYVGAKVTRTGKNYFCVRTRSSATITPQSSLAMAALAAANAILNAVTRDLSRRTALEQILQAWLAVEPMSTYRSIIISPTLDALKGGNISILIQPPAGSGVDNLVFDNPFAFDAVREDTPVIPDKIITKFWRQLAYDGETNLGIVFNIDNAQAVAFAGNQFDLFNDDFPANILNLTINSGYVRVGGSGGSWLTLNGHYVTEGDTIEDNAKYTTTSVAP